MEIVLLVLVVGLLAALVWYLPRRDAAPADRGRSPWGDDVAGASRVVLDLEVDDPDAPYVRRLLEPVVARIRASTPDLVEVVIVDRTGTELAVVRPDPPLAPAPELPPELHEPHLRRSATPDPTHPRGAIADAWLEVDLPDDEGWSATARPFAARFDLSPQVRGHLEDDDHPAAVVAAILAAAGRTVERQGDLVRTGDVAIVVADVHADPERALSGAFLRLQRSGARHGLIIRLGYADPRAIARREQAAQHVRHAGPEAIQRMADAVAVGADPLAFAIAPAVVR